MATYKLVTDNKNTYFTNNKITLGTAAPTSGTHAAGDIVLSSSANSTAFGWICTTAGTPGTWKVLKSGSDVTSVSGNAGTATQLTTARNIKIGNKSASFNGTTDISYTLSEIGAAASSHTHSYAGSSSAGGAATSANKVNTNLIIKLNSGTTEGTNLFTFNGSTAKTINITPSAIGAAASSHGTHLSLGTTSSTAYRGDYGNTAYVHSQAAHAPSNAQKNSDITKAEIEAKLIGAITSHTHAYAATSHTHSYLPLSGGTMSGQLTIGLSTSGTGFKVNNGEAFFDIDGTWNDPCENEQAAIKADGRIASTGDITAWGKVLGNGSLETYGSAFAPTFAITSSADGTLNNHITTGPGDGADWVTHNMKIRSHWGIGFHDYQDNCNIVFCTRTGNLNTKGLVYSEGGVSTTQWISASGSLTVGGTTNLNNDTNIANLKVTGYVYGETCFAGQTSYEDPWSGVGCAIKATGNIACTGEIKASDARLQGYKVTVYPNAPSSPSWGDIWIQNG